MENIKTRLQKGISGTGLKTIALILMVLDHIHYFFGFTGIIPTFFSMIGRLSAPLFLFSLVEGFTHTHSRIKYFLKVYIISIVMNGLLFFMAYIGIFRRGDGFFPMNGMMTAFAILIVIFQGIEWICNKKIIRGLLVIIVPFLLPIVLSILSITFPKLATPLGLLGYTILPCMDLNPDATSITVISGIILYLFRKHRKLQVGAFATFNFLYYFVFMFVLASKQPDFVWTQMFTTYYEWFSIFAAILMLCYNGQRGSGHQKFFYIFYPAHIYLFHALGCLIYFLMNRGL